VATKILNTQSLLDAELKDEPFRWAFIEESFIAPSAAEELASQFPADGFGRKQRRLGESSVSGGHYLNGRGLITRETGEIHRSGTLSPAWLQVAEDLLSDDYREAMSSLTGIDLDGALLEAIVFRQPEGGYLDPHPDNPAKPVSQVFYFNSGDWPREAGGCLRILRSSDIEDYTDELIPACNTSVVLVRCDDSWHGYKPVRGDQTRLCLQIFFCRPDMKFATEYGPDWTRPPRITRPLRIEEAGQGY
jgi:SM-20-related protein